MRLAALRAIARKEFIQMRRDKATTYMVVIFPMMMLILYGFGIRYDVKSVPMTIFDQDRTAQSRQYIERFESSPYFLIRRYVDNYRDLQTDIDRGKLPAVSGVSSSLEDHTKQQLLRVRRRPRAAG